MSVQRINGWVLFCDGCSYAVHEDPEAQVKRLDVYETREDAERLADIVEPVPFAVSDPDTGWWLCQACMFDQPELVAELGRAARYFKAEFMVDDDDTDEVPR
jgi:hypothetical protein